MRKFTFIWFIQNYSNCWHKKGEALESPTFFAEMMHRTSWKLHLYPRGKADVDSIALYLKRSDKCNGPETVALHYELSFLDANGRVIESVDSGEGEFEMTKSERFGLSDFLERPEYPTDKAFTPDVLRVRCTMSTGEGELDKEIVSYAKTQIGYEKISFIITIENFAAIEPNRKMPFDAAFVSEDGWKISGNVYIKSEPDMEDEVMVEVSLNPQNTHLITCQIYILNLAGKEEECGKIDTRNEMYGKSTLSIPIKPGNGNLLDKRDVYLPNDKLTLCCECTFPFGIEFQEIKESFHDLHLTPLLKERVHNKNFTTFTTEPRAVSDDLWSLFQDGIHTDIHLKNANKKFPAHKSVLCARSPVFKSMLMTDTKERLDSIQVDLDDSTIHQLLLFLYTDTLEDFQWESIKKLYYAANTYRVQRLKDMCSFFLISGLNSSNMCDLLILADRHQDFDLKMAIQKFLCKRDKKIFCSHEWESFMETNLVLAMKTMHFYMKTSSLCK